MLAHPADNRPADPRAPECPACRSRLIVDPRPGRTQHRLAAQHPQAPLLEDAGAQGVDQKPIGLNDNRAVYRSRLLLDFDRAARGTSLALRLQPPRFRGASLASAGLSRQIGLNKSNIRWMSANLSDANRTRETGNENRFNKLRAGRRGYDSGHASCESWASRTGDNGQSIGSSGQCRRMVDVRARLSQLALQPPRRNHARQRRQADTRMVVVDRRAVRRARGHAVVP